MKCNMFCRFLRLTNNWWLIFVKLVNQWGGYIYLWGVCVSIGFDLFKDGGIPKMTFSSFLNYIIFITSSLRYVIGTFFAQANSRWNPLRRVVGWSAGTGGLQVYENSLWWEGGGQKEGLAIGKGVRVMVTGDSKKGDQLENKETTGGKSVFLDYGSRFMTSWCF